MHLNDTELLNSLAQEKLADFRQEADTYRRFRSFRKSYRSSLAQWLNAAAERLDPSLKPQHLGS